MIQDEDGLTEDFYNKNDVDLQSETKCTTAEFFLRGLSYVGFHFGNKKLAKLNGCI